MPKIYFYKLKVDDGGAPCVQDGLLSLAICKPMLRRTADVGDIILGFAANSLHPDNRLIYVAEVTERLDDGNYYKRRKYARRADCIYKWDGKKFQAKLAAEYHGAKQDLQHDLGPAPAYGRANTLLSTKFRYFGGDGTDDYKSKFSAIKGAIECLGQGHRVRHTAKLLEQLLQLAKSDGGLRKALKVGEASGQPRRGVNHRGGACSVLNTAVSSSGRRKR